MKTVFVSIQFALFIFGPWAAENPAQPEAAIEESCAVLEAEPSALEAAAMSSSPALLEAVPATPQGLPACPQLRNCSTQSCLNGGPCRPGQQIQDVDTGITSCTLPGGSTFTCPSGQTIHVTEQNCVQCRCCNANPPCICPLQCNPAILSVGCQ
jgi:hypothetical protein